MCTCGGVHGSQHLATQAAYLVQLFEEVSVLLPLPELAVSVGFLHAQLPNLPLALQKQHASLLGLCDGPPA